jgi:hypothetical protein
LLSYGVLLPKQPGTSLMHGHCSSRVSLCRTRLNALTQVVVVAELEFPSVVLACLGTGTWHDISKGSEMQSLMTPSVDIVWKCGTTVRMQSSSPCLQSSHTASWENSPAKRDVIRHVFHHRPRLKASEHVMDVTELESTSAALANRLLA